MLNCLIYTYIHSYIHTCIHTYLGAYMHTCTYTCKRLQCPGLVYVHTLVRMNNLQQVPIDTNVCMRTYICTYRQMYVHTQTCIYILSYAHTYMCVCAKHECVHACVVTHFPSQFTHTHT